MKKKVKLAAVILLAAACVAVVAAYIFAGSPPGAYRPESLDANERQTAAKQFYRHMMDIDDAAQTGETFSVHITQQQLNRYLAAVDEIAAMLPEGHPGHVQEIMDAAGLKDPAVSIDDGSMTIMARAGEGGRVVSIELEAWVDSREMLHVNLKGVRIGCLPMSRWIVRGQLAEMKSRLSAKLTDLRTEQEVPGGGEQTALASRAAEYAGGMVLAALEGQVIRPEARWRHRQLRLAGMEASGGELVLYVAPMPKPPKAQSGGAASSQTNRH